MAQYGELLRPVEGDRESAMLFFWTTFKVCSPNANAGLNQNGDRAPGPDAWISCAARIVTHNLVVVNQLATTVESATTTGAPRSTRIRARVDELHTLVSMVATCRARTGSRSLFYWLDHLYLAVAVQGNAGMN